MILLHVTYKLKPNVRSAFIAKLREYDLAAAFSKQPGNITYEYFVPIAEEDVLLLIDAWEDEAAFQAHFTNPASGILKPLKEEYVLETSVHRFELPSSSSQHLKI